MLSASQAAALDDLSQQWGNAYDIAVTRAGWIAKRLDNGRALVAATPEELHTMIRADYEAEPVPDDVVAS